MKKEDCIPGTKVIIQGTIESIDNFSIHPIEVSVQRGPDDTCRLNFSPEFLKLKNFHPKRRFQNGDKVRYINHGREAYNNYPLESILYEVTSPETPEGWVYIRSASDEIDDDFNDCVKWYDLEFVESVKEDPPFKVVEAKGVYFRVVQFGHVVHEIRYEEYEGRPFTREDARQKAQELCDELNRKYDKKLNN